MNIDLETILPWSAPKPVTTKLGPRLLRKASPTDAFSAAWKTGQSELRAAGISWSKEKDGTWTVCWWTPLPKEQVEAQNQAIAASRATDADVDIPRPDGLEYMPFQRAGILFILKAFGDDIKRTS